jgi:hypothetical protein
MLQESKYYLYIYRAVMLLKSDYVIETRNEKISTKMAHVQS